MYGLIHSLLAVKYTRVTRVQVGITLENTVITPVRGFDHGNEATQRYAENAWKSDRFFLTESEICERNLNRLRTMSGRLRDITSTTFLMMGRQQ